MDHTVISTTWQNIAVHHFTAMVFSNRSASFQQGNDSYHTELFENSLQNMSTSSGRSLASKFLRHQYNRASVVSVGTTSLICNGSTMQLTGIKESAGHMFIPENTFSGFSGSMPQYVRHALVANGGATSY